jgi:uncharacterized membrane protein
VLVIRKVEVQITTDRARRAILLLIICAFVTEAITHLAKSMKHMLGVRLPLCASISTSVIATTRVVAQYRVVRTALVASPTTDARVDSELATPQNRRCPSSSHLTRSTTMVAVLGVRESMDGSVECKELRIQQLSSLTRYAQTCKTKRNCTNARVLMVSLEENFSIM